MSTRQDVVILSTDALTQLTCTVVKEHCSAAPTSAGSSIQKNAKEPHPKVYHSVSTKKTQRQEVCNSRDVTTPTFGLSRWLGVTVNIVSPSPRCLLSRSLSSSVDSSSDLSFSHHSIAQEELENECEIVSAETNTITRPNTLSLDREMSTTSSGSGKTTPCNIPRLPISEQSSCTRLPVEEKLASSCPPVPMPSFWMSPVQRGDAEVVIETRNGSQQQFLVRFMGREG